MATTYNGGGKGTIQPTTTLTDQLRCRFRYIRLCLARLDIGQRPSVVGFRDQFETKDTILGQEHIFSENIHPINTLRAETVS